jgi:hypothetical protein
MHFSRFFTPCLFLLASSVPAAPLSVVEPSGWYTPKIATSTTKPASPLGEPATGRIDVRGMGDTAWSYGATPAAGQSTPPPAKFDEAVRLLDPSGVLFRGDLNFVNWESVVGERCTQIRNSVDFYFLTNPEAIRQAVASGFNLFGLANNHAQDCTLGQSTLGRPAVPGPLMTSENFARLAKDISAPFNWAGVASPENGEDELTVRVVPFQIGNRIVRVALGAVATFSWDIPYAGTIRMDGGASSEAKIDKLVARFNAAAADFRILSIHTQDGTADGRPEGPAFLMLKHISERFVREASGDVVFGEGPHTWGGVKVIPSVDGKLGVVFTSLGNFIHAGLRTNSDNYIARGLWDRDTLRLCEVQVHPFMNLRTSLSLYSSAAQTKMPNANFQWDTVISRVNGKSTVGYSARFP